MMDHPIAINLSANEAFREHVYWHTIGIVNLQQETRIEKPSGRKISNDVVGTGSALFWRNRYFFLTAKHVLEKATPQHLLFFFRPTGSVEQAASTRDVSHNYSVRSSVPLEDIVRCPWEDLAVITLSEPLDEWNVRFHSLPETAPRTPDTGTDLFAIGFPTDKAFEVARHQFTAGLEHRDMAVAPSYLVEPILPEPENPHLLSSVLYGLFDFNDHYLIPFEGASEGRDPYGFSGAGLWHYDQESSKLWVADPKLAGVCLSYYLKRQTLKVVRVETVFRFLEETFQ